MYRHRDNLRDARTRDRAGAFTLTELLVSLAIMGMIAAAVAGLSVALSSASEHGRDRHLYIQEGRVAMRNLESYLKKARLVTATDGSTMVLWMEDTNGDELINATEIGVFELDGGSGEVYLNRIVYPDSWGRGVHHAMDYRLQLYDVTNAGSVSAWIGRSSYRQKTVLAGQVTSFETTASPAAPLGELVGLQLTVGSGERTIVFRSAVRLRADWTHRVSDAGGYYVLNDP